jgi:hypothetical protein
MGPPRALPAAGRNFLRRVAAGQIGQCPRDRVDDEIAEFTPGPAMTIASRPAIRSMAVRQRDGADWAETVLTELRRSLGNNN